MYQSTLTNSRLLESILEVTSDGLIVCDEMLVIMTLNSVAAKSLGMNRQELVHRRLSDVFNLETNDLEKHLRDGGEPVVLRNIRIKSRGSRPFEVDLLLKDHSLGDERAVLVNVDPEKPSDPLRSLQLLTERAQEGLFQIASDNRLRYVNEHMRKMFGYASANEMLTLDAGELFAKKHAGVVFQQNSLLKQSIHDLRILLKRKDSSTFWGQISWIPDQSNDGIIIYGRIRDITDVISYETLLKEKAEKLSRATEQLDTFLYHASHDLRSPITTIQGIINLRKLEMGADDPYSEMITGCLNNLTDIVRQLTALSNNTQRRATGNPVYFETILQSVFADLRTHKNFEFIEKTQELNINSPYYSDVFRINLILKNVIKNAYDFRDKRKTSSVVSVSVTTSIDKAVIEVFDNGSGIPKAHIDKVFDIFYRASTDSTGSGIGLYVAKEAAKMLHGSISLRSVCGIGTSVTIELPNSPGAQTFST